MQDAFERDVSKKRNQRKGCLTELSGTLTPGVLRFLFILRFLVTKRKPYPF
jgi:hypothetical protein